jgi:hypothetical protein
VTTVRVGGAVLLILLIGCSKPNSRIQTRLNRDAELSGELPYNPLQWDVISSTLNPADHTVSTISGNEKAVAHARHYASQEYPVGSVLAIITWVSRRTLGGSVERFPEASDPSSSLKYKPLSIMNRLTCTPCIAAPR